MKPLHYDLFKRVADVVLSAVLLVVTLPVQGVVALAIWRKLGSPVLFRQRRPGLNEEIFELIKFRTLREPDPARGLVTDAERMTPLGSVLRSTSIDELPTLWNVLKGDMSMVGPRPLLERYLDRYSPEQRRRHEVRPGVTGLAQVAGRNSLTWDEKLALDVEYVDQRSLGLDALVLAKTFGLAVRRTGISSSTHTTMDEFLGHESQMRPTREDA